MVRPVHRLVVVALCALGIAACGTAGAPPDAEADPPGGTSAEPGLVADPPAGTTEDPALAALLRPADPAPGEERRRATTVPPDGETEIEACRHPSQLPGMGDGLEGTAEADYVGADGNGSRLGLLRYRDEAAARRALDALDADVVRDCVQASVEGPDVGEVVVFQGVEPDPGVPPFPDGFDLRRYWTDAIVPELVADDADLGVVVDVVRRGRHLAVYQVVMTGFGVGPTSYATLADWEAAMLMDGWVDLPPT